jgi:hypothetical protein
VLHSIGGVRMDNQALAALKHRASFRPYREGAVGFPLPEGTGRLQNARLVR